MINIGNKTIEVKCPKCQRNIMVTLDQVANESTVPCTCGAQIALKDNNGNAKKTVSNINKSLNDLQTTLRSLGK